MAPSGTQITLICPPISRTSSLEARVVDQVDPNRTVPAPLDQTALRRP